MALVLAAVAAACEPLRSETTPSDARVPATAEMGAGSEEGGAAPPLSGIALVPPEVFVDATRPSTFQLEARLWSGAQADRKSVPEGSGVALTWSVTPSPGWLVIQSSEGQRVTLRVVPGASPPAVETVRVSAAGWQAESRIVPGTSPDQDMLIAPHSGGLPSVFLARGVRSDAGEACASALSAFVWTGLLGRFSGDCDPRSSDWGTAVLDSAHAMALLPAQWTPAADTVAADPLEAPPRSLPVSLWIVLGGDGDLSGLRDEARQFALDAIAIANSTLLENRVGVELAVVDTVVVTAVQQPTTVADCVTGDTLVRNGDRPGTLRIYYVNSMGGARGFTCAATDAFPQRAIYVAWPAEAATTIVHEIGHALGLTLPGEGHTDRAASTGSAFMSGFDATNVMTSGIGDMDPVGRHRFSVGQVFRMNADSASWLNLSRQAGDAPAQGGAVPPMACQCGSGGPGDSPGLCPRLQEDVAPPGGGGAVANSWECFDLLRLPALDKEERPATIVAGRRWRSPPSDCAFEVSDTRADHWGAYYLRLANLTRPGSCPSWAAVFFMGHGWLFRELPDQHDVGWSDAADTRRVDTNVDALAAGGLPLLVVRVQVYFPSSQLSQVEKDTLEAKRIFGEANRTGLQLAFDLHPSADVAAECPADQPGVLSVCYEPSGSDSEGLPFRIGMALGLAALTSTERPMSVFQGNLMHPAPDQRGERLTLGQVFRINALRRPGDWPNCSADARKCPPLEMDVAP